MTEHRTLDNRVKAHRLAQGWSQAELAERAGISRTAVTAIEGERLSPSVAVALSLADALGCTVEDLFGRSARSEAKPSWAWEPAGIPCRVWHAEVGGRVLRFPVEAAAHGENPHDGIYRPEAVEKPGPTLARQTLVMACCDPAAGLMASQFATSTGFRLLVFSRSSQQALDLLQQGVVHVAGIHLATTDRPERNRQIVESKLGGGFRLLRAASWEEGIAVAPGSGIRSVHTAVRSRLRWVGREPGSGARQCLDELLEGRAMPRRLARNHRAVAEAVRSGWADAGVCVRLASDEVGLDFLKVREEAYDLCISGQMEHDPRIQALLRLLRSATYRRVLSELPGYGTADTGELQ